MKKLSFAFLLLICALCAHWSYIRAAEEPKKDDEAGAEGVESSDADEEGNEAKENTDSGVAQPIDTTRSNEQVASLPTTDLPHKKDNTAEQSVSNTSTSPPTATTADAAASSASTLPPLEPQIPSKPPASAPTSIQVTYRYLVLLHTSRFLGSAEAVDKFRVYVDRYKAEDASIEGSQGNAFVKAFWMEVYTDLAGRMKEIDFLLKYYVDRQKQAENLTEPEMAFALDGSDPAVAPKDSLAIRIERLSKLKMNLTMLVNGLESDDSTIAGFQSVDTFLPPSTKAVLSSKAPEAAEDGSKRFVRGADLSAADFDVLYRNVEAAINLRHQLNVDGHNELHGLAALAEQYKASQSGQADAKLKASIIANMVQARDSIRVIDLLLEYIDAAINSTATASVDGVPSPKTVSSVPATTTTTAGGGLSLQSVNEASMPPVSAAAPADDKVVVNPAASPNVAPLSAPVDDPLTAKPSPAAGPSVVPSVNLTKDDWIKRKDVLMEFRAAQMRILSTLEASQLQAPGLQLQSADSHSAFCLLIITLSIALIL